MACPMFLGASLKREQVGTYSGHPKMIFGYCADFRAFSSPKPFIRPAIIWILLVLLACIERQFTPRRSHHKGGRGPPQLAEFLSRLNDIVSSRPRKFRRGRCTRGETSNFLYGTAPGFLLDFRETEEGSGAFHKE